MLTFTFIRTKKCGVFHFFELKSVIALNLSSVYKDNRNRFPLLFFYAFLKKRKPTSQDVSALNIWQVLIVSSDLMRSMMLYGI